MSLLGKTCEVRIYGPRVFHHCCEHGCDECQVGCFNPAAYRNPFFGKSFLDENHNYWWRCGYGYAEFLCAKCYDDMVSMNKDTEAFYRDNDKNYVEDPEYTKILETL